MYQLLSVDYTQLQIEENMFSDLFNEKIELLFELPFLSLSFLCVCDAAVSQRAPNVPSPFFSTKQR